MAGVPLPPGIAGLITENMQMWSMLEIARDPPRCLQYFQDHLIIAEFCVCPSCGSWDMAIRWRKLNATWRCTKTGCRTEVSVRKGSFVGRSSKLYIGVI